MVPGSLRSGHDAESCIGPKPNDGLPEGSRPDKATADVSEDHLVCSIVDKYLGPSASWVPP